MKILYSFVLTVVCILCLPEFGDGAGFGEGCPNGDECNETGTVCSSGTCACDTGYYENGDACSLKVQLGSACSSINACATSNAACTGGFCTCPTGYYDTNTANTPAGSCTQTVAAGIQCTAPINGVSASDPCTDVNAECSVDSGSVYRCQCTSAYYNNGGQCLAKVQLGSACSNTNACATSNAACTGGFCTCPTGYYDTNTASTPAGNCTQKVAVGTLCTAPVDGVSASDPCIDTYAECSVDSGSVYRCQCTSTYYNNGGQCLAKVQLGSACSNTNACATSNAACTGGFCTCLTGFYDTNTASTPAGNCIQKVAVGTLCTAPVDGVSASDPCIDTYAECSVDSESVYRCQCISTYYNNGGQCFAKVQLGSACSNTNACATSNATCTGGFCTCPTGYYDTNTASTPAGNCIQKVVVGTLCTAPGDGVSASDPCIDTYAECSVDSGSVYRCQCTSTYYNNGGQCFAKVQLGSACSNTNECVTSNAACTGGFCTCPTGFYDTNTASTPAGNCIQKVVVGTLCTAPVDGVSASDPCIDTYAECSVDSGSVYRCQCTSTYYNNGGQCFAKVPLGSGCSNTNACATSNAACTGGFCTCPTGYYDTNTASTPAGNCLQKVVVGTLCTAPVDGVSASDPCIDTYAECSVDSGSVYRCQCTSTYYNNGGQCFAKVQLGSACSNTNACATSNAACTGGFCTCPTGYYDTNTASTPAGNCLQTVAAGSQCTAPANGVSASDPCIDDNAECSIDSGSVYKCQCTSSYYTNGGQCFAIADLGDVCTIGTGIGNTVQCQDSNANCVNMGGVYKCQCQLNYFDDNGNIAGGACAAMADLSAVCVRDTGVDASTPCLDTNANCVVGGSSGYQCQCASFYFDDNGSNTGGSCAAMVDLDVTCTPGTGVTISEPCLDADANCVDVSGTYKCQCKASYFDTNGGSAGGECAAIVDLGAQCTRGTVAASVPCLTPNSDCVYVSGIYRCQCQSSYFDTNGAGTAGGSCATIVDLGEVCTRGTVMSASDPCLDMNADCVDVGGGSYKCQCTSDYFDSNGNNGGGSCDARKNLDGTCNGNPPVNIKQCHDENAVCKTSGGPYTCQCNQGYHQGTSTNKCEPDAPLGDACSDASGCSDPAAACNGKCYCNAAHYDDNGLSGGGNCRPVSQLMARDITFSAVATTGFTVSWSIPIAGSEHVSSYTVGLSGGSPNNVGKTTSATSSELSSEIVAGQTYTVIITTYNMMTEVGVSRSSSNSKEQATKPNKPGKITDESDLDASDSTILVKWTASVGVVSVYTVQLLDGDNVVITRDTPTTGPEASLTSSALKNGYWYNITIMAKSKIFDSGKTISSEIHKEMIQTVVQAPQKPYSVAVKDIKAKSFMVSWMMDGDSPGVTNYTVAAEAASPASTKTLSVAGFDSRSIMVSDLEEYWNYTVIVRASTTKGMNTSDKTIEYRTLSAAPGAVADFSITTPGGDHTKLAVSWKIPAILERNGLITKYMFKHNDNSSPVTAKDEDNFLYTETVSVIPEQRYNFTVYAVNNEGVDGIPITEMKLAPAGVPKNTIEDGVVEVIPASKVSAVEQTSFRITILENFLELSEYGQPQVTGLVACAQSMCDFAGLDGQSKQKFDSLPKWSEASKNGYTVYRVTKPSWRDDAVKTGSTRRKRAAGEIQYNIGAEQCSDPNVYCNGPLVADTPFIVKVVVCTNGGCLYSNKYGPFVTKAVPPEETPVGPIIGGVIGGLVVIALIVVIIVFVYKRRSKEKGTTTPVTGARRLENINDIDSNQNIQKKRPVRLDRFEEYLMTMHKDTNLKFSAEYEDLKAISPKHACESADLEENRAKNRYINILPFDHTRVKLFTNGEDDKEDFINANYLPGYRSKREYIGCQGPLPGTIEDFWRMIWEQNVSIIVMLTLCKEGQKVKCEQYWPTELADPKQYGDVIVEVTSQSTIQKYDFRMMKIKCGSVERKLKHFHFLSWLDFQANVKHDIILDFINHVRGQVQPPDTAGPMVVHCSAGVGRTGTYIALEYLMQFIEEHDFSEEVDIFDLVLKMRENRAHMVQTEQQYIFIHDCVVELMERKKRAESDDHTYVNQAFKQDDDQEQSLYENMAMKTEL